MKRLPIIVLTFALCLLIAGCGAKPNEPADGDSAKAGIVERMAMVKAEEIKYISSFFSREHVSAEDMASVLNAAAEHHSEQPGHPWPYTYYQRNKAKRTHPWTGQTQLLQVSMNISVFSSLLPPPFVHRCILILSVSSVISLSSQYQEQDHSNCRNA